jgi:hypothetical protein
VLRLAQQVGGERLFDIDGGKVSGHSGGKLHSAIYRLNGGRTCLVCEFYPGGEGRGRNIGRCEAFIMLSWCRLLSPH